MNFLADERNITNYNRTKNELELYLLFCIVVAGKTAYIQAKKLEQFLLTLKQELRSDSNSPFELIRQSLLSTLFETTLIKVKLGQYKRLSKCFKCLVQSSMNLQTCTVEDLEFIPGIGPKTARFFLIHSRSNMQLAALDTHILRYMREQGYAVPKSTPVGKNYAKIEKLFLSLVPPEKTVADYDFEIWKLYARENSL